MLTTRLFGSSSKIPTCPLQFQDQCLNLCILILQIIIMRSWRQLWLGIHNYFRTHSRATYLKGSWSQFLILEPASQWVPRICLDMSTNLCSKKVNPLRYRILVLWTHDAYLITDTALSLKVMTITGATYMLQQRLKRLQPLRGNSRRAELRSPWALKSCNA